VNYNVLDNWSKSCCADECEKEDEESAEMLKRLQGEEHAS